MNCIFDETTLGDATFISCIFTGCKFQNVNFEDAIFQNSQIVSSQSGLGTVSFEGADISGLIVYPQETPLPSGYTINRVTKKVMQNKI